MSYLFSDVVLVDKPRSHSGAPVLQDEGLGVLLALAVAEAALGLGAGHPVLPLQVHFQELAHLAADLGARAPRTAVDLLPQPAPRQNTPHLGSVFPP